MSIVYTMIAKGSMVVAEYTDFSGNFLRIARTVLRKLSVRDNRITYVYDRFMFHSVTHNKITYMCLADDELSRNIAFSYLEEVESAFIDRFNMNGISAETSKLVNEDFASYLQTEMTKFNKRKGNSPTNSATSIDISDIPVENIEKILRKTEKIELMVDRISRQSSSFIFESSASQARRRQRNIRIKMGVLIVLAIFVLILFILVERCDQPEEKASIWRCIVGTTKTDPLGP